MLYIIACIREFIRKIFSKRSSDLNCPYQNNCPHQDDCLHHDEKDNIGIIDYRKDIPDIYDNYNI